MSRTYSKKDVEISYHQFHSGYPMVNVKDRSNNWNAIREAFPDADEKQLERAIGFWFDGAQELFWNEDAPDLLRECLGKSAKLYSAGRLGGWLVVEGLDPVDEWDAIALGRWRKFEAAIRRCVKSLTTAECAIEDIEANRWAEPMAERYNFVDRDGDDAVCLVDLKKQAIEAGYGAVVC